MHQNERGYTIVELLAVVLMMSAFTAIMAPPVYQAHRRMTVERLTSDFVGVHELARATAIQHGRVVELHFDNRREAFWLVADTTLAGGPARKFSARAMGEGDMTSNRGIVCFDGRGLPTTRDRCEQPDATVVFRYRGRADTVEITPMGVVKR